MKEFAIQAIERANDLDIGPWEYSPGDASDDWCVYNGEFTFVKQDDSGVPIADNVGEFWASSRTLVPQLAMCILMLLDEGQDE